MESLGTDAGSLYVQKNSRNTMLPASMRGSEGGAAANELVQTLLDASQSMIVVGNKTFSKEHCRKIREAMNRPEVKAKRRETWNRLEVKAKFSELSKKRWDNPEFKAKRTESMNSPQTKAKFIEAMNRPEVKAKMSGENNPMKRPEVRAKNSEAQKKAYENPILKAKLREAHNRPEYRAKLSESIKTAYQSPEAKANHREACSTPEYRTNHSEITKRFYEDPEHRANHREIMNRPEIRAKFSGEKHYLWKGGVSFAPYCPKFNMTLKEKVRNRFGQICLLCGKSALLNGEQLSVHHLNKDKMQGCKGKAWSLVPLCRSCHSEFHNASGQASVELEFLLVTRAEEYRRAGG